MCVCASGVCLGGVSANLQYMHKFEIDHVFFLCEAKRAVCASTLLVMLISRAEFTIFFSRACYCCVYSVCL